MLPTFTPEDHSELIQNKKSTEELETLIQAKFGKSVDSLLDYKEALYYGDT